MSGRKNFKEKMNANVKGSLNAFARDPSFKLRTSGDTVFGDATGKRSRKLMSRGELTAAGKYLQDERGVNFPRRAIDQTQRTYFRGRSEYTTTQDGREIKLRTAQGDLTARGKELYTQPEITVEVPATQIGTGRLGKFELETYWTYTESEYPEIGEIFRRHDDRSNTPANMGLIAVKSSMLDQIRKAKNLLAQESDMVWVYRDGE